MADTCDEYICLSSDASRDTYPLNTQSNFTNIFPRPFHNRENKTHFLRLEAVSMVNLFGSDYD